MTDHRDPASPDAKQQKGGFGAFAQRYRDRWAANHPSAGNPESAEPAPAPAAEPATTDAAVDRTERD